MDAFLAKAVQNRAVQITFLLVIIFLGGRYLLFGSTEKRETAPLSPDERKIKEAIEESMDQKQKALFQEVQDLHRRIDENTNETWKEENILGYRERKLRSASETQTTGEILKLGQELKERLGEIEKAVLKKEEEPAKTEKAPPAPAIVDTNLYQVLSQRFSADSGTKINALRWLREKSKEKPELILPEVARLLIELLSDQERLVQIETESLLLEAGRKDGKAVKKELVSYMLEQDKEKAEKSALLLIKIGNSSVPALTEALDTTDRERLKRIGWCLKKIGPEAIQSLRKVYEEGSVSASIAAHELLGEISPPKTQ